MSTNVEEMPTRSESKSTKYPLIGLKVLELVLIVICLGLIDDAANNSRIGVMFLAKRTIGLSYATLGAFLIFTAVYLLMKLFKDDCPWKTSALMSLIGLILFLASGSMMLRDWSDVKTRGYWPPNTQRLDLLCGAGSVAIVVAIVFIIDLILTILIGIRGELD